MDRSDEPITSLQQRWLVRISAHATWPHALSAEDLFTLLGTSQGAKLFADDYVLVDQVGETLEMKHLGPALNWVLRRTQALPERPMIRLSNALQRLEDVIIAKAWLSDEDSVTATLAEIAVEKIRRHEPLVARDDVEEDEVSAQTLFSNPARRRRFAGFLLPRLADGPKEVSPWLICDKTPYLYRDDLGWLVERQTTVSHTASQWTLEADLILRLADLTIPSVLDLVLGAAEHNRALADRMKELCAPLTLGSDEARKAKQHYNEQQEGTKERTTRRSKRQKKVTPPAASHIAGDRR